MIINKELLTIMYDLHTCRLCQKWEVDLLRTGPMYKYGVRHYAHARCGMSRWGREWLDKQPVWVISQMPYFFAEEMGILDYLRGRIAAEKPDTDLSWLPNKGAGLDARLAAKEVK